MADIRYVTAWRRDDSRHAADAMAFWRALELPLELAERRVKALCSLAYAGGRAVGLTTIEMTFYPILRARFAFYRCAVAPDFRQHQLATLLTRHTLVTLEGWSLENPQEKIQGLATLLQAHELDAKARNPIWGEYYGNLNLAGYTNSDEQVRVAWFRHARLETAAR
jgi:hypothetical protein